MAGAELFPRDVRASDRCDMTIERVQASSFPPNLIMSNIERFSEEITMKMNQLPRQQGWNQHLRQDSVWWQIQALDQADINAFMGRDRRTGLSPMPLTTGMVRERPPVPCSPPLKGIVIPYITFLFVSSQACISDSFRPSRDNGLVFGLLYVLDIFLISAACLSGRLWLLRRLEYNIQMIKSAGTE